MLITNWSEVLKSDLDKLSQLTSSHRKTEVTKLKEGERRSVTILFLDIQGFTAMSEKLDPEDVQLIIDNSFKILTSEVEKYQGYIDKYEGDRLMALFGSRQASDQDSERALRAALGMKEKFKEINQILAQRNIKIGIRVGVNTGLVVTGRIGKGRDQDFTVMGDAVNLASRLETNAPPGEVLVNEDVRKITSDIFLFESLGEIQVKGKTQPIPVFIVKGLNPSRAERWERSPFTKRSGYVRRELEQKIIETAYAGLQKEQTGIQTVAFSASAGIGKSRLVHEFFRQVVETQPGAMIFRLSTTTDQGQPLSIFAGLVRKVFEHPKKDEILFWKGTYPQNEGEKLKSVLEFIAGITKPDERLRLLDPQALQLEIHLAIRHVFEALARFAKEEKIAPLFVHVEDLQWLDTASLTCLEFLAANLSKTNPILFLWTYRPEFILTEGLQNGFKVQAVQLAPLTEEGCSAILTNVLGSLSLTENEQEILIRRSGGNPFFMEELIQALVDEGTLKREGEEWVSTQPIDEMSLPDSINRILLGRFDHLDADHKEILMAASVAGETFPVEIMSRVCTRLGLSETLMESRLQNIMNQGFMNLKREGGMFGKQYAFRHALTRDVVYSTLLNHNKKILHALVGKAWEEVLQDAAPDHSLLLYKHFYNAGASSETLKYGRMAVEQALRQHLYREGLKMVAEMKEVLSQEGLVPADALETKVRMTDAECKFFDFLGNRQEQLRCIQDLEKIDRDYPEKKLEARLALHRASYYSATGDYKATREIAQKGLQEMGEKGRVSKLRMDLIRIFGIACYSMGDYPAAIEQYSVGLGLAEELKDRSAEGGFYNTLGLIQFNMGKSREALEYYSRAHNIMTEIGDRRGSANALGNQGLVYWTLGEYSRALEDLIKSHNMFKEIGFRKGQAATLGNIGVIRHKLGQYEDALKCYERALQLRREIKDHAGEGYDLVNTGVVYMNMANYKKAMEYLNLGEKLAREVSSSYLLTEALNSSGILYRKSGENEPPHLKIAFEKATEALAIAQKHHLIPAQVKAYSNLARVKFLQGFREEGFESSKIAMDMLRNQTSGVEGSEEEAYINHYYILKELGRLVEAKATLSELVHLIEERAVKIKEEDFRKSFLGSVRQNSFALEEWEKIK